MNRRSFLKGALAAGLAACTQFWPAEASPEVIEPPRDVHREAAEFMDAMNRAISEGFFYGKPTAEPRQFVGLEPRYSNTKTYEVSW